MSNLLAPQKRKERRSAYTRRIIIALSGALAGSALVGIFAFLPAYIALRGERVSIETEIQPLSATGRGGTGVDDRDVLIETRQRVEALSGLLSRKTIASDSLSAVLDRTTDGVRVSGIQYVFKDEHTYSMRISGFTGTRTQLQSFITSLQSDALFSSATVPVSALADADKGQFIIMAQGSLDI